MIRKLVIAGLVLVAVSLVLLFVFSPFLRFFLSGAGSFLLNTGHAPVKALLRGGLGIGVEGVLLGTFLGFGMAIVGLVLTAVGVFSGRTVQTPPPA